jgi:iron complex outermembrane receptor protein
MVRKLLSLFALFFALVAFAGAQTGEATGKITDGNGEALIGANVFVKGSTLGTITNIDGIYNLAVPIGPQVLVASFIGYANIEVPVEIKAGQISKVDFVLIEDIAQLDELIVIGYGVQKKSDKTGAVSQIKAEEMNGGVITDPMQAIQGKSAGVMITKKGGDPNSGFSVKIRGAAGFSSKTEPLYVIDGVPGADPTAIAPEDIETFNILKDAASTAIYGSRGSNGVVLINTKRGNSEQSQVQFNMRVSGENVAHKLDLLDASEIRQYVDTYNLDFTDYGANTDWQNEIFQTGLTTNYNLNFSGGTAKSNYYASITQANFSGVMKGTAKDRTIGKVNLTHKALDDKLTLSGSMSGTFEQNDYENYDGFDKDDILYQAFQRNPTDPLKNSDGSYFQTIRAFNYENPLSIIDNVDNIRDAKRYFGNFRADLEVIKGLIGSVNFGYTRDDQESSYFRPKGVYAAADNGYGSKSYENTTSKLFDGTITYIKSLQDLHNFNTMVGYSWQESVNSAFWAKAANPQSEFLKYNNLGSFVDDGREIGSRKEMWRLIGFFGRLQYNYNSKYYASASLREDGSSKFGADSKWGFFPTFAIGWDIHKEAFLEGVSAINQLKLRGSYGISGNQEIGSYRSQYAFKPSGQATNPETGEQVTTYSAAWHPNPELKWEETTELNFGIDFALFDSKISGTLEVYNKKTDDLLGEYAVPVPPYYSKTMFRNSGSMSNNGIELFLQGYPVDKANLKWKTSINISHNKTIITDLGEFNTKGSLYSGYLSGRGLIGDQNYVTANIVGEELGSFYLPVYKQLSSDGVFLYESESGGITRELSSAKRRIVGSPLPDLELGWTNNFTFYQNITVDFAFRSLIGNDVYNATKMFFDSPGLLPQLNALPDAIDWKEQGRTSSAAIADIYVEDGSFLKLDYISVGYAFNTSKRDWVKKINVYVSANNLFTITKYSGIDPETTYKGLSFGIDQYDVYPKTKSVSMGLSATF